MHKSGTALTRNAGRALLMIVVSAVMAACNLGPQAPEVSPTATPLLAAPQAITPTFTVTPLIINGECLERPILVASAPGSYQTVYESAGCRVVFQISAATAPWTLTVTVKL